MAIHTHAELGLVEEISDSKGWVGVKCEDGSEHKVRRNTLTEVALTDEDEQEGPTRTGDVFPAGIRDTYERGTTEEGAVYIDNGDRLAAEMRGWELQDVAAKAAEICGQRTAQGWLDLYDAERVADGKKPLNPGMVRMNLGNRIRGAISKAAKAAAKAAAAEEAKAAAIAAEAQ
jgi:hypothetical protein